LCYSGWWWYHYRRCCSLCRSLYCHWWMSTWIVLMATDRWRYDFYSWMIRKFHQLYMSVRRSLFKAKRKERLSIDLRNIAVSNSRENLKRNSNKMMIWHNKVNKRSVN
jgi:hypothetical protein